MTLRDILQHRLSNQKILQDKFMRPADVLTWLGAIQGQDYAGALWSIGLRMQHATIAEIEQAFIGKTIVRTWALRGTLHMVAASDLRWLLALVAPRIIAGNAGRYRELHLDDRTLARSTESIVRALEGGRPLNRTELLAILERQGISTAGQRAAYMLQRASLDGLVCQGVMRRNVPTFMLADDLPQGTILMDREGALAELAKRYFQSRSPASLQDFAWWSGLSTADARAGMSMIGGGDKWMPHGKRTAKDQAAEVHLLPGFDEYLLGYKDRTAMLESNHRQKWSPGNSGMFNPIIIVNGRVAGTWKRRIKKDGVIVETNFFPNHRKPRNRDLEFSVSRYGAFLGLPIELSFTA